MHYGVDSGYTRVWSETTSYGTIGAMEMGMRYEARYQDDRDTDESAIAECYSVDDASDAIVLYFARCPNHYEHCIFWRIVREDGLEMARGGDVIMPGENK